jgi:putative MATE family efflux protein
MSFARPRFGEIDRSIMRLAVPALGSLAIDPLLTMTDTAFVARVGTQSLAALGVDAAIISFAFFAFNFLAFATTPLVARALGGGNRDRAAGFVGSAMFLAVVLGVVMTMLVFFASPLLVAAMGAEGEVAELAVVYLRIRSMATVAVLMVLTGHGAFRGHKDTRTPLIVALGVNLTNLALDPLLIFTAGLGLAGAAWATVVAQWIGAVWFFLLIRRRQMARFPRKWSESLPAILTLGKNGALLTTRSAFLLFTFAVAASTATRLGADRIAAHQLVFQGFILAVMVADSLEISAQALVGEEAGRGDPRVVDGLAARLVGWGMIVGLLLLALVGLARPGLAVLTDDPAVEVLAVAAAGVAALILPVGAVVFVADGVFSGLLAFGTMAMSTAVGCVAAVAALLWSPLGSSLEGVWWAIGLFLVVRGLVFLVRYRSAVETAVRS